MNDLAYKNYFSPGFGHGFGHLLENLIYLELRRAGFDVYVGVALRNKEIDFVAKKLTVCSICKAHICCFRMRPQLSVNTLHLSPSQITLKKLLFH